MTDHEEHEGRGHHHAGHETPAHDQTFTHSYVVHYPAHEPREDDPNYVDFAAYRKGHVADAKCAFGVARDDFSDCDPGPDSWPHGLELHHAHIEFAMQNAVDLTLLEHVYPGVSDPTKVGAWVESGENLMFLCVFHHRGHGGVHVSTSSDYEAQRFIHNLISGPDDDSGDH
jgi:hypothetical protein